MGDGRESLINDIPLPLERLNPSLLSGPQPEGILEGHNISKWSPLPCGPFGLRSTTRVKNFFFLEEAGFETRFSVPNARALPLSQSYADIYWELKAKEGKKQGPSSTLGRNGTP